MQGRAMTKKAGTPAGWSPQLLPCVGDVEVSCTQSGKVVAGLMCLLRSSEASHHILHVLALARPGCLPSVQGECLQCHDLGQLGQVAAGAWLQAPERLPAAARALRACLRASWCFSPGHAGEHAAETEASQQLCWPGWVRQNSLVVHCLQQQTVLLVRALVWRVWLALQAAWLAVRDEGSQIAGQTRAVGPTPVQTAFLA
jgi:hypothetical protein